MDEWWDTQHQISIPMIRAYLIISHNDDLFNKSIILFFSLTKKIKEFINFFIVDPMVYTHLKNDILINFLYYKNKINCFFLTISMM